MCLGSGDSAIDFVISLADRCLFFLITVIFLFDDCGDATFDIVGDFIGPFADAIDAYGGMN